MLDNVERWVDDRVSKARIQGVECGASDELRRVSGPSEVRDKEPLMTEGIKGRCELEFDIVEDKSFDEITASEEESSTTIPHCLSSEVRCESEGCGWSNLGRP